MGNGYWTIYNKTNDTYRGTYETKTQAMKAIKLLTS
jgi:hypothetical protein